MSTRNRVPKRLKNLTPEPVSQADRLRKAIRNARQMQRVLRSGDEDVLAKATLLQGVLSGDVIAASIQARQRLQRENLHLRRRIATARLKTELVKQRLLEAEAQRIERHEPTPIVVLNSIREVYGLPPHRELPALPADVEIPAI